MDEGVGPKEDWSKNLATTALARLEGGVGLGVGGGGGGELGGVVTLACPPLPQEQHRLADTP